MHYIPAILDLGNLRMSLFTRINIEGTSVTKFHPQAAVQMWWAGCARLRRPNFKGYFKYHQHSQIRQQ